MALWRIFKTGQMNQIILTTLFVTILVSGQAQYVFKDKEPKNFFTDLQQGPAPKWSPHGKRFALITNTKNKSKIAIITRDSIEFISGAQNNFEWSHDGRSIIYTAKDENKLLKVFKYDLKTKERVRISHNSNFSDFYPSISLGDSLIAYYNAGIGNKLQIPQIYYANTNEGIAEKFIDDPKAEYFHPKWSPTGNLFLYWKSIDNKTIIEIIEIKTGRKIFSIDGGNYDFMDWSSDEQEILCTGNGKLLKLRLKDGLKTELSSSFQNIIGAKWSPKNDLITFDGDGNIYTINLKTLVQRQICSKGLDPNWHPSGNKIIFVKDENGFPIYEVDISGENLRLLFNGTKKKGK